MEGLPDTTIPIVLSYLKRTMHINRCACISKEWASCARQRLIEVKAKAARAKAQVRQCERSLIPFLVHRSLQCVLSNFLWLHWASQKYTMKQVISNQILSN